MSHPLAPHPAPRGPALIRIIRTSLIRAALASLVLVTLVLVALVLAAGLTGCGIQVSSSGPSGEPSTSTTGSGGADPGAGPNATASRSDLARLAVADAHSSSGYSRDRFPTWNDQGGGCDTRDLVLRRQGKDVAVSGSCKIVSGTWHSAYDGKDFTDPQRVDIDHTVPLANAWRSGADAWDDSKRRAFANDLVRPQLIAVSAAANRSKSDKDPSQWLPPDQQTWCWYAQRWIAVKRYWDLTVTKAEKAKLSDLLDAC